MDIWWICFKYGFFWVIPGASAVAVYYAPNAPSLSHTVDTTCVVSTTNQSAQVLADFWIFELAGPHTGSASVDGLTTGIGVYTVPPSAGTLVLSNNNDPVFLVQANASPNIIATPPSPFVQLVHINISQVSVIPTANSGAINTSYTGVAQYFTWSCLAIAFGLGDIIGGGQQPQIYISS